MNATEISQMEKFEKNYWWHIGKKNLVKHLIEKNIDYKNNKLNILEIGCGAGEITMMLQNYGNVSGNDISTDALDICKSKGLTNLIHGDITQIDLKDHHEKFDIVLALDVLEHIQDDVNAMKKIYDMLKPKGYAIISVPAYKFLWSQHDEALEHKRRYTRYELTKKLRDLNLMPIKSSHFVFSAFPPIALYKFLSNFISREAYPKSSYILLPEKFNAFMIKVLEFESKLMDYASLPFGTTIVVLAQKN